MANHPQVDSTAKADSSDISQAINGSSSELSSSTWLDMRSASGYLDAQPQRFTLYDSAASTNSAANASDAPLTIRTGVATDGASSNTYLLPQIDFFDSAVPTSDKPLAGGIGVSEAKPSSDAGNEKLNAEIKWEIYSPSDFGTHGNMSDSSDGAGGGHSPPPRNDAAEAELKGDSRRIQ